MPFREGDPRVCRNPPEVVNPAIIAWKNRKEHKGHNPLTDGILEFLYILYDACNVLCDGARFGFYAGGTPVCVWSLELKVITDALKIKRNIGTVMRLA